MLGLFSTAGEQRLLLTSLSPTYGSRGGAQMPLFRGEESLPHACAHRHFLLFHMAMTVLVAVIDWHIK